MRNPCTDVVKPGPEQNPPNGGPGPVHVENASLLAAELLPTWVTHDRTTLKIARQQAASKYLLPVLLRKRAKKKKN